MCQIPIEIDGAETIVRAIKSPSHVDKNHNLKAAAFRSRPGTDDVSVIRHTYMGSDFCKAKGKSTASPASVYFGLASIKADAIRSTGSTVEDSRQEFFGHAHISHGLILPPNEPLNSGDSLVLQERCKALRSKATLHRDPDPNLEHWTGAVIS